MGTIDHFGRTPVWRQLHALLRDAITSGEIPEATFLPSLKTLTETYEVSRQTAFRAVQALQDEGLAVGVPGRGVWVIPPGQRPKPKQPKR